MSKFLAGGGGGLPPSPPVGKTLKMEVSIIGVSMSCVLERTAGMSKKIVPFFLEIAFLNFNVMIENVIKLNEIVKKINN